VSGSLEGEDSFCVLTPSLKLVVHEKIRQ